MISQKKLEANRRNAQKSTGPKTPEGKAISSQNGLTHGLTSRKCPILPGENEEEYRELQHALTRDLKPRGAMQRELVEDLVQTRWKIRRIPALEAELMWREQEELASDHSYKVACRSLPKDSEPDLCPIKILASKFLSGREGAFDRLDLYRARLERQTHTILRELRKLREETGDVEEACEECAGKTEPTEEHGRDVHATEETCKTEPTVRPSLGQADSSNPLASQENDQSPDSCPNRARAGHLPAVGMFAKPDNREANHGDTALDGRYNLPQGHPGVKPSAWPVVLDDKESPL
jgi:hypothetical protein